MTREGHATTLLKPRARLTRVALWALCLGLIGLGNPLTAQELVLDGDDPLVDVEHPDGVRVLDWPVAAGDDVSVTSPSRIGLGAGARFPAGSTVRLRIGAVSTPTEPTIEWQQSSLTVAEADGSVVLPLQLVSGAAPQAISLALARGGSAEATDVVAPTAVTWGAGATSGSATITVIDDADVEAAETLTLTLQSAAGYQVGSQATLTITITDNDTPSGIGFAQASQTVSEGAGLLEITVVADAPLVSDRVLQVSVAGTADESDRLTPPATITVAAGTAEAVVPLRVLDDTTYEGDETIELTLSSTDASVSIGQATHTITVTDDDQQAVIAGLVTESQPGQEPGLTEGVTPSAGDWPQVALSTISSGEVRIEWRILPDPNGLIDYTTQLVDVAGTLVIPAGVQSARIPLQVIDETIPDLNQPVTVELVTASGATIDDAARTSLGTIYDNEQTPALSFAEVSTAVFEGDPASLNVVVSPISGVDLAVELTATGFAPITTIIPAGSASFMIDVPNPDNTTAEADRSVVWQLSPSDQWLFGPDANQATTLQIVDDDFLPVIGSRATGSFAQAFDLVLSTVDGKAITYTTRLIDGSHSTSNANEITSGGVVAIAASVEVTASAIATIGDDVRTGPSTTWVFQLLQADDLSLVSAPNLAVSELVTIDGQPVMSTAVSPVSFELLGAEIAASVYVQAVSSVSSSATDLTGGVPGHRYGDVALELGELTTLTGVALADDGLPVPVSSTEFIWRPLDVSASSAPTAFALRGGAALLLTSSAGDQFDIVVTEGAATVQSSTGHSSGSAVRVDMPSTAPVDFVSRSLSVTVTPRAADGTAFGSPVVVSVLVQYSPYVADEFIAVLADPTAGSSRSWTSGLSFGDFTNLAYTAAAGSAAVVSGAGRSASLSATEFGSGDMLARLGGATGPIVAGVDMVSLDIVRDSSDPQAIVAVQYLPYLVDLRVRSPRSGGLVVRVSDTAAGSVLAPLTTGDFFDDSIAWYEGWFSPFAQSVDYYIDDIGGQAVVDEFGYPSGDTVLGGRLNDTTWTYPIVIQDGSAGRTLSYELIQLGRSGGLTDLTAPDVMAVGSVISPIASAETISAYVDGFFGGYVENEMGAGELGAINVVYADATFGDNFYSFPAIAPQPVEFHFSAGQSYFDFSWSAIIEGWDPYLSLSGYPGYDALENPLRFGLVNSGELTEGDDTTADYGLAYAGFPANDLQLVNLLSEGQARFVCGFNWPGIGRIDLSGADIQVVAQSELFAEDRVTVNGRVVYEDFNFLPGDIEYQDDPHYPVYLLRKPIFGASELDIRVTSWGLNGFTGADDAGQPSDDHPWAWQAYSGGTSSSPYLVRQPGDPGSDSFTYTVPVWVNGHGGLQVQIGHAVTLGTYIAGDGLSPWVWDGQAVWGPWRNQDGDSDLKFDVVFVGVYAALGDLTAFPQGQTGVEVSPETGLAISHELHLEGFGQGGSVDRDRVPVPVAMSFDGPGAGQLELVFHRDSLSVQVYDHNDHPLFANGSHTSTVRTISDWVDQGIDDVFIEFSKDGALTLSLVEPSLVGGLNDSLIIKGANNEYGVQAQITYLTNGLGAADPLAANEVVAAGFGSVDLTSGNLQLSFPMESWTAQYLTPDWGLTYNSRSSLDLGYGPGWLHTAHERLYRGDDLVVFAGGDGSRELFVPIEGESDRWEADPRTSAWQGARLERLAVPGPDGAVWQLTSLDGNQRLFDDQMRLIRLQTRQGDHLKVGYAETGNTIASFTAHRPDGEQIAAATPVADIISGPGLAVHPTHGGVATIDYGLTAGVTLAYNNDQPVASVEQIIMVDPQVDADTIAWSLIDGESKPQWTFSYAAGDELDGRGVFRLMQGPSSAGRVDALTSEIYGVDLKPVADAAHIRASRSVERALVDYDDQPTGLGIEWRHLTDGDAVVSVSKVEVDPVARTIKRATSADGLGVRLTYQNDRRLLASAYVTTLAADVAHLVPAADLAALRSIQRAVEPMGLPLLDADYLVQTLEYDDTGLLLRHRKGYNVLFDGTEQSQSSTELIFHGTVSQHTEYRYNQAYTNVATGDVFVSEVVEHDVDMGSGATDLTTIYTYYHEAGARNGLIKSIIHPDGIGELMGYDGLGRIVEERDGIAFPEHPLGIARTTYDYSADTPAQQMGLPNAQQSQQIGSKESALVTTFTYTDHGLIEAENDHGTITTYQYNRLQLPKRTEIAYEDADTTTLHADEQTGRLASMTMAYDPLGRETQSQTWRSEANGSPVDPVLVQRWFDGSGDRAEERVNSDPIVGQTRVLVDDGNGPVWLMASYQERASVIRPLSVARWTAGGTFLTNDRFQEVARLPSVNGVAGAATYALARTTVAYDALLRPLREQSPRGVQVYGFSDLAGLQAQEFLHHAQTAGGEWLPRLRHGSLITANQLGLTLAATDVRRRTATATYTGIGLLATTTDHRGVRTRVVRDGLRRELNVRRQLLDGGIEIAAIDGGHTEWLSIAGDRTQTDSRGLVVRTDVDVAKRAERAYIDAHPYLSFERLYTGLGEIHAESDVHGFVRYLERTAAGQPGRVQANDMPDQVFGYSASQELLSHFWERDGDQYRFDIEVDPATRDVTKVITGAGLVTESVIDDATGMVTGHLSNSTPGATAAETTDDGSQIVAYNLDGQPTKVIYENGWVASSTYNILGELTEYLLSDSNEAGDTLTPLYRRTVTYAEANQTPDDATTAIGIAQTTTLTEYDDAGVESATSQQVRWQGDSGEFMQISRTINRSADDEMNRAAYLVQTDAFGYDLVVTEDGNVVRYILRDYHFDLNIPAQLSALPSNASLLAGLDVQPSGSLSVTGDIIVVAEPQQNRYTRQVYLSHGQLDFRKVFDRDGELITSEDYTYDDYLRLDTVVFTDGAYLQYQYEGTTTRVGQVTKYAADLDPNNPSGASITYTIDDRDDLQRPEQITMTRSADTLPHDQSPIPGDSVSMSMTYAANPDADAAELMVNGEQRTLQDGYQVSMTLDTGDGNLQEEVVVTDRAGRQQRRELPGQDAVVSTFDTLDRATQTGTQSMAYDPVTNQLSFLRRGNQYATFQRDRQGRLTQVTIVTLAPGELIDDGNPFTPIVLTQDRSTKVERIIGRDPNDPDLIRTITQRISSVAGVVSEEVWTFERDQMQRVLSMLGPDGTRRFVYDQRERLVAEWFSTALASDPIDALTQVRLHAYDSRDNRLRESVFSDDVVADSTWSFPADDQLPVGFVASQGQWAAAAQAVTATAAADTVAIGQWPANAGNGPITSVRVSTDGGTAAGIGFGLVAGGGNHYQLVINPLTQAVECLHVDASGALVAVVGSNGLARVGSRSAAGGAVDLTVVRQLTADGSMNVTAVVHGTDGYRLGGLDLNLTGGLLGAVAAVARPLIEATPPQATFSDARWVADLTGSVSDYTYDRGNRLTKAVHGSGPVDTQQFYYDGFGQLRLIEAFDADPDGNAAAQLLTTTRHDYDVFGRRTETTITDAAGTVVRTVAVDWVGTTRQRERQTVQIADELGVLMAPATTAYHWEASRLVGETGPTATGDVRTSYLPGGAGSTPLSAIDYDADPSATPGTILDGYVYGRDGLGHARGAIGPRAASNAVGYRDLTYRSAYGVVMSRSVYADDPQAPWSAGQLEPSGPGYRALPYDAASGLVRMMYRDYDPAIGRFISEDPAQAGDNWYGYAGGDPVNKWDPSGLWEIDFERGVAVAEDGDTLTDLFRELELWDVGGLRNGEGAYLLGLINPAMQGVGLDDQIAAGTELTLGVFTEILDEGAHYGSLDAVLSAYMHIVANDLDLLNLAIFYDDTLATRSIEFMDVKGDVRTNGLGNSFTDGSLEIEEDTHPIAAAFRLREGLIGISEDWYGKHGREVTVNGRPGNALEHAVDSGAVPSALIGRMGGKGAIAQPGDDLYNELARSRLGRAARMAQVPVHYALGVASVVSPQVGLPVLVNDVMSGDPLAVLGALFAGSRVYRSSFGGSTGSGNYVYRVIRADEDPTLGLTAKRPDRGMTVHGHISTGSRNRGSQYISTRRDLEGALARAEADGGLRVVRIDLDAIQAPGTVGPSRIIDLSTPEAAVLHLNPASPAFRFAIDSREVLVVGHIPASAIQVVTP